MDRVVFVMTSFLLSCPSVTWQRLWRL